MYDITKILIEQAVNSIMEKDYGTYNQTKNCAEDRSILVSVGIFNRDFSNILLDLLLEYTIL